MTPDDEFLALFSRPEPVRIAIVHGTMPRSREVLTRFVSRHPELGLHHHPTRNCAKTDRGDRIEAYALTTVDALRGPRFHAAWLNTVGAPATERTKLAIDLVRFATRLGDDPQVIE